METGSISDFGFEMYDLVKRIVIAGLEILRYWFGITNPEQRRDGAVREDTNGGLGHAEKLDDRSGDLH